MHYALDTDFYCYFFWTQNKKEVAGEELTNQPMCFQSKRIGKKTCIRALCYGSLFFFDHDNLFYTVIDQTLLIDA